MDQDGITWELGRHPLSGHTQTHWCRARILAGPLGSLGAPHSLRSTIPCRHPPPPRLVVLGPGLVSLPVLSGHVSPILQLHTWTTIVGKLKSDLFMPLCHGGSLNVSPNSQSIFTSRRSIFLTQTVHRNTQRAQCYQCDGHAYEPLWGQVPMSRLTLWREGGLIRSLAPLFGASAYNVPMGGAAT